MGIPIAPTYRLSASPSPRPTSVDLDRGLVGHWAADGSTRDQRAINDGTLMQGADYQPGRYGESFSFDGIDDYFELANRTPVASEFSFSAWVSFDDGSGFGEFQTIFNNNQFSVRKNSASNGGGFSLFVKLVPISIEPAAKSSTVPEPGAWYHVASTWSGTTLRLYVNGELEDSVARVGEIDPYAVESRLGIGDQVVLDAHPLDGRIDEVRLYERTLNDAEVSALYSLETSALSTPSSSTPTPTPTLAPGQASPTLAEVGPQHHYSTPDGTDVSITWMSLGCTAATCDISYASTLTNRSPDFTPITQGALVGVTAGGLVAAMEECPISCDDVETTLVTAGKLTSPRGDPITHLAWMAAEACTVGSTGVGCSVWPSVERAQLVWAIPTPQNQPACDQLLAGQQYEEMVRGYCSFQDLDMTGLSFEGLDLTGIHAIDTNFTEVDLSSATLDYGNLSGATFQDANLIEASLANADLTETRWNGVIGYRAMFNDADLSGASLSGGAFTDADFTDVLAKGATCNGTIFRFTTLYSADFNSSKCAGADFTRAVIYFADFSSSILERSNFSYADVQGSNFSDADLDGVIGLVQN